MELRHLRYFLAVAEELNFRKAAERLNLSAPTLSQQIRHLEESLGASLLNRSTVRVVLTPVGDMFLRDVRQILQKVDRAREITQNASRGKSGTLRIGNLGASGYSFMPRCMETFRQSYPDVDTALVNLDVEEQFSALQRGEIEIGFTPVQESMLPEGIGHFMVMCVYWNIVVHDGHRLAGPKKIQLKDIAGEPLVIFSDAKGNGPLELIQRVLAENGIKPGPVKVVRGIEACLAMIAAAQGVSFFPNVPHMPPIPGLKMRAFAKPVPGMKFELRALWRETGTSPHIRNFLDILRAHAIDHTVTKRVEPPTYQPVSA